MDEGCLGCRDDGDVCGMKALDSGRITGRMAAAGARRCAALFDMLTAMRSASASHPGRAWGRCFGLATSRPGAAAVD